MCYTCFFSSSFAYKQMVRSSSMTAQPHLTITLIRDLLVCNYSNSFKDKVEKYFTTLEKLNHQAQILYSEAKQILIKELKVCTEGITSDSYTTKYLSTSFKVTFHCDSLHLCSFSLTDFWGFCDCTYRVLLHFAV